MSNAHGSVSTLSPAEKRALLSRLLSDDARRANSFQLSFAQQRLWLIHQMDPGAAVYNIPAAIRLSGALKVEALANALNEVIRRHESLRTAFAIENGVPMQVVAPHSRLALPELDLLDLPEASRELRMIQLAKEAAMQPFDLTEGPLLRVCLLRLGDTEHALLLTIHHIIFDGWSTGVLIGEIATLYETFAAGHAPSLPELPIQYAEFAVWQREWLKGETLEEMLSYWRRQLKGSLPGLDLPTDRPRPPVQSFKGARESFTLDGSLSDELNAFNLRNEVTLFMTLLSAFKILLYRYSGQKDIIVGTPTAGRNWVEIEDLIGFFVNTLALRTDLSEKPSIRELVRRVREVTLGAFSHQDLPFEKLVEELQPQRDLSRQPLFQMMFVLQNVRQRPLKLQGLTLQPLEIETETAKFDLTLTMTESDGGLIGSLEYSGDLFDAATARRMIGHLQNILRGIVIDPNQRISDVALMSATELNELLVDWNQTGANYQMGKSVHELIEENAERIPAAIAVVDQDQTLTYLELNRRANHLANHLLRRGVKTDDRIGICVRRSAKMVEGLLGILKAGCAYVPLDPLYPKERLELMIEDSRISILVTEERFVEKLAGSVATTVLVDAGADIIALESSNNPGKRVTDESLAYVIYTSGSAGRPKGVAVCHRGVMRLLFGSDYVHLDANEIMLHMSPISFDASTFELWGALVHGARCVLAPGQIPTTHELSDLLRRNQVSTLWLTASLFNAIVDEKPESLSIVRQLLVGGEALSVSHIVSALGILPATQLINGYGPTESTTFTCSYRIPKRLTENIRSIPIGRPIGNTQVYLLDSELQPVPVGVFGELHIGGAGLARGYVSHPDLTAEKFIPNPFSGSPGDRLYKTGDLARYMPDGDIEFVGRIDRQVKIRGFRIEPGEIETAMKVYPEVREAVVVVREDIPGEKRLVAYVVESPGVELSIRHLKRLIEQRLPEYMRPSAFVRLESMPLTASGKVDLRALPAPVSPMTELEPDSATPKTPIEATLMKIWAEILGVEKVSGHDNFFELGGHSLLATKMVSQVREVLNAEIPLRSLFEFPTVASLAPIIESALKSEKSGPPRDASPIVKAPRGEHAPLSFAQQRLWFIHNLRPDSSVYNIPVAVRLVGKLETLALERTLSEIIRRHEALRTVFRAVDGELAQVINPAQPLTLNVLNLAGMPDDERESEVKRVATEEARRPFDLVAGPLIRARLLRLSQEEHIALLTMHHIVADGWSIGIFIREVATLYAAFRDGRKSPLPELPIQYADFAIWQRQRLQGDYLQAQLRYWRGQLGGNLPVLELPTDRPRPPTQSFRGARRSIALSRNLSEAINSLSRQEESLTLYMTLLAAFNTLLYRYTGQEDIVLGAPIANRNRREIEGLIGFFVNTQTLRIDLSGNPTFKELLRRVREVALQAYAHQDLPFERLVEELQPDRDLSRTPLFQVVFDLQAARQEQFELAGLKLGLLGAENDTSKFDLSMLLNEHPESIIATIEYSADLFDESTIARMLLHFQTLLEGIVGNPEQRLSELRLLPAAEREQILLNWNQTEVKYLEVSCIHELFERQAATTPSNIAITDEREQLSYAGLNRRANQLARYLRKLGVGPEVLVAVGARRSARMVVEQLAVLKAGGAFVPLDMTYPRERLNYMLEDSGATVLLLPEDLADEFRGHAAAVVCPDIVSEEIAEESVENLANAATTENLVYVMYTSGSTGNSKGVLITHVNLLNLVKWHQRTYDVTSSDRATQLANVAFDASVWELWPYLTAGASVFIPDDETLATPSKLVAWLASTGISISFIPTPLLELLLYEEWPRDLALRAVLTGGDRLKRAPETDFSFDLYNNYGPTENTVVTSWTLVPANQPGHSQPSIGRPIFNTQVHILDAHQEPGPIGVVGEIQIGGESLARGYLNRPSLTAEKFIPNPFSGRRGARLYKTGDLARYLPDGALEFVGRMDRQVKIRGFRIELGEIEAAIARHPEVREMAVVVREDIPDEKRLVAYVVASPGAELSIRHLKKLIEQRLPEYMRPSAFVRLDALPLTANGKVDYRSLPAPDSVRLDREIEHKAPETDIERIIAAIWQDVLYLDKASTTENFFEAGGNSISIVLLNNKLREIFGREIPVAEMFKRTTIRDLAQYFSHESSEEAYS